MNKSVLFVLPTLGIGGAERVTINLANQMSQDGIKVGVFVLCEHGQLKKEVSSRVEIIVAKKKKMILAIPTLVSIIRSCRYNNIISVLPNSLFAVTIGRLFARTAINHVTVIHSAIYERFEKYRISQPFKAYLKYKTLSFCYELVDEVVTVSNGVKSDFERCFSSVRRNKINVIYNPVIIGAINDVIKPTGTYIISTVGRLIESKNIEQVLRLSSYLKKIGCDFKVNIIGDGPHRGKLESKCKQYNLEDIVSFKGYVEPNKIKKYLDDSHIFVLCSRSEGLPTVLIEALYSKCHVISSDCLHGPSEILMNGRFGNLFEVDNDAQLFSYVINILNAKEKHTLNGLEEHLSKFTMQYSCDKYEKLII